MSDRFSLNQGKHWLAVLVVLMVLASYTVIGRFFHQGPSDYYPLLAEGFRRGQLNLAVEPHPALLSLPDPYRLEARDGIPYLWDASFYRGKYYLYFSPLPALLFYLPVRLITGAYPSAFAAGYFFATIAVLFWAAFLAKALQKSLLPPWVWIVYAGLATMLPYTLAWVGTYHVAILCGAAATAGWAYFLLRFHETERAQHALLLGLCLGLAIASRPFFGLLLPVTAVAIWKNRHGLWAAVPAVLIGITLLTYNYLRFNTPLEFGALYQLSFFQQRSFLAWPVGTDGLRYLNHLKHYLFWLPTVQSDFPYISLRPNRIRELGGYPGFPEGVFGVVFLMPLAGYGIWRNIFALASTQTYTRTTRAVLAGAGLIFFFLPAFWMVTARYELDFLGLLALVSAVSIERGMPYVKESLINRRIIRTVVAVLLGYSVVINLLVGFASP